MQNATIGKSKPGIIDDKRLADAALSCVSGAWPIGVDVVLEMAQSMASVVYQEFLIIPALCGPFGRVMP